MARLIATSKKSGFVGGHEFSDAAFGTDGTVDGISAADAALILAAHPEVTEVGHPGVHQTEATAGNATVTITVPSGKYWRLLGLFHLLVTDGNAADRVVVVTSRTVADATIEAISHAIVTASTTAKRTTLFGVDDYVVGNEAVAAQGKLQMATKPTATNTIVVNGQTFTWVAALTGVANQLLIGADIAASQAAWDAAMVTRIGGGTLHHVSDAVYAAMEMTFAAFGSDESVATANVKGTAGNALATTETFTDGTDTFDATTLGTETAGVDAADKLSTKDWPDAGAILTPGEDVLIAVTSGVAGDALDTYLSYLEYDANPVA